MRDITKESREDTEEDKDKTTLNVGCIFVTHPDLIVMVAEHLLCGGRELERDAGSSQPPTTPHNPPWGTRMGAHVRGDTHLPQLNRSGDSHGG